LDLQQGYTLLPTQTSIPIPLRCYLLCLENANLKILVGIIVRPTRLIIAARYTEGIKAFLLVSVTLAKILVIAAVFMHLKYERINLILITFAPLVLSVILFAFTFPETFGSQSHVIEVR
jgi:hypothetical protein